MSSPAETKAPTRPRTGEPAAAPALGYQPSLDGLRAVAVLLVMLYHGGVGWAHGGFLGVDIFFVLSGYLITSLLLAERARWGSVDVTRFWLRRARRLLPALFLVLAFVGLTARLYEGPARLGQLRGDGLASLAYVANWRFMLTGQSYFDQFSAPSPLRHLWSLGIEEQWYWVYPLVLGGLVLLARRRRAGLAATLLGLAALSALWTAWLAGHGASAARLYYGTDTRVQELLIGSGLAVLVFNRPRPSPGGPGSVRDDRLGSVEAVVGGLLALFVIVHSRDGSRWLYDGGFALLCVSVALVLDGLRRAPRGPAARALSWRPLVLVGLISYGLYLWHWPLFLLLTPERTGLHGWGLLTVRFATTLVAAAASYVLVERPIRTGRLTVRLSAGRTAAVALAAVCLVLVCLVAGTWGALPAPAIASTGTYETRVAAPGPGQRSLLVIGDSPGRFLSWYLPRDLMRGYAISESTVIGCGLLTQTVVVGTTVTPAQPQCDGYLDQWTAAARQVHPDVVLFSMGYWDLFDKLVGGSVLRVGTPAADAALLARLEAVRTATTGGRVPLLVLDVPCFGQASWAVDGVQLAPVVNDAARQQHVNAVLREFAARHPDVTLLDDRSLLCPGGSYQPRVDGVLVRPDGVHVGAPGGRLVGRWLLPLLDAAGRGRTS
ncbi:MAG TPA: acyltransferase family protein [Actinomycetes bacterium]|nr:acyltransferase family protein [Actinomycetes bacterium]